MTDQKSDPTVKWIEGYDWTGDGVQTVRCLDCRMAVTFPSGQQRHGTHRIAVPEPVVEEPQSAEDAPVDSQEYEVVLPAVVCSTCGTAYEEVVPFCSRCGTATEPPDTDAVIEALRQEVTSLRSEVSVAREEYAAFRTQSHGAISSLSAKLDRQSSKFTWRTILPQEKWTVAWGVWWRISIAGALLYVLMFLALLAAVNGDS